MRAADAESPATTNVIIAAIRDFSKRVGLGLSTAADAESISAFLAESIACRAPDQIVIRIDSTLDASGAEKADSPRLMRIAIVNADSPFLVDSISGCVTRLGMSIHALLHPVLPVLRDDAGRLVSLGEAVSDTRESIVYVEVDHVDAKGRQALEESLRVTLLQVSAAVGDWAAMAAAMREDMDRLPPEERDLLQWLLQSNFTHLGYQRVSSKDDGELLGICRAGNSALLSQEILAKILEWCASHDDEVLILKSNVISRVHRNSLIDLIVVPIRRDGLIGLSIHAGLWTSSGIRAHSSDVPVLRRTLDHLMDTLGFDPMGHAGKGLVHGLTNLPHDIMLCLGQEDRERIALAAKFVNDRPRPQLVLAQGLFGCHLFAFVWLPRDEMNSSRRKAAAQLLSEATKAPVVASSIALDEGGAGMLRFILDLDGETQIPDAEALTASLSEIVRGWGPAVEAALSKTIEAKRAAVLARRYAPGFPASYRADVGAAEAATDILRLHRLTSTRTRDARLYRNSADDGHVLHLVLYSLTPITLSDAVPALENFGFRVMEEMTTPVGNSPVLGYVQRLIVSLDDGAAALIAVRRAERVERVVASVMEGASENDRFNDLLIAADLAPDSVVLLRAIFRYLRQTGIAYGLSTVVMALRRAPRATALLVQLFGALHDPARQGLDDPEQLDADIELALTKVAAIDDDRILRLIRAVIKAVLRTNAFVPSGQSALAFKIDSAAVPGLPSPVPWREIWVYSPRVEGIHLRAGPIARGGLRWSDRRDDFRTEILGLLKAQRAKNAVIVPSGAKGGFFPKQLPNAATAGREAWLEEGAEAYRVFIRALLSVTDNVVKGKIVHPTGIAILDGEDPYFVVAADKGTATFSDTANAIALELGFWLGDAFASGGSNGYDHKAMGITAKGAWISVQHHFRQLGLDVQVDPVSVIGVGDMSGDVFGNGMLLSKSIRLIAAFDHRHIFIDPAPDAAAAWSERDRLFQLPRSSWDDYDRSLISAGGGVFSRGMKSIPLTDEMRSLLNSSAITMEPAELISALLTAEVDLLWFGGIGTYVKAAVESHSEVGDTSNDRIRIDAEQVRARVIGEGANLGITQNGRIAYSWRGGRINTDFIDNSAGVDCSDNEVNIKIALNRAVAEGRLSVSDRNILLARMTDSVAALVLEDNRLQAIGISIAEIGGAEDVPAYLRLMERLAKAGRLDRKVEGLPNDEELLRRAQQGRGLTRPELAVLFATTKLSLQSAIEQDALATDRATQPDLFSAFPQEMQGSHGHDIENHQLRREIVATKLANRIVNRLGIISPLMLAEDEGYTLADIARAFVVVENLFDLPSLWASIDCADMDETSHIRAFRHVASIATDRVGELCYLASGSLPPKDVIDLLKPGIDGMHSVTVSKEGDVEWPDGTPLDLVAAFTRFGQTAGAAGIADLAIRSGRPAIELALAGETLTDALGLGWLQTAAGQLMAIDPWERLLVSGVERDLRYNRLSFLSRMGDGDLIKQVHDWLARHEQAISQFRALLTRGRSSTPNAAMLAEIAARARILLLRE